MNANVSLELGISHAIGKRCLVVGQTGFAKDLFESLQRMRYTEYSLDNQTLEDALREFLTH